jgi:Tfp pilus assembly protein PilO
MSAASHIAARSVPWRRALALLLIPVAVALVWCLLVVPLRWVATSQGQWRAQVRAELARVRGHAQALAALREDVAKLPSQPVWQRFYAQNGPSVGAALQQDLTTLGAAAGFSEQSITPLPTQARGQLTAYSVRLMASGTIDQLQAFVVGVRGHPRYLRLERLTITAPQVQAKEQNAILSFTLDIDGFAREPAP